MTVSTQDRNDYLGNGATDTYSYGFKIFAATDLEVTTRDLDDVETTLTYPTDFSVSGVGASAGGSIVLTAGDLDDGFALTIRRVVSLVQSTDLRNQSSLFPDVLENQYDRQTMMSQQINDAVLRSMKLGKTEAGTEDLLTIPFDRASKFLAFDAEKNPIAIDGAASTIGIDNIRLTGNVARLSVINAALTQDWFFGINASDNNKLYISAGHGAEQGIVPNITIEPGTNLVTIGKAAGLGAVFGIVSNDAYGEDDHILAVEREGTSTECLSTFRHICPSGTPQTIIALQGGRGTLAAPAALHSGDIIGILDGRGCDGSAVDYGQQGLGWTDTAAQIAFKASELWTSAHHGTYISFGAVAAGGTTYAEVMRLKDPSAQGAAAEMVVGYPGNGLLVRAGASDGIGAIEIADQATGGNPSLAFYLDRDTGLMRPATNALGFMTAGVQRARFDANGSLYLGGAANADASALFEMSSTTKGFLLPRMTTTQRDAISSPTEGLVLYNSTTHKLTYRNNTTWIEV